MASWRAIAIQQLNTRAPELKAQLIEKGDLKTFLDEKADEAERFHQQNPAEPGEEDAGQRGVGRGAGPRDRDSESSEPRDVVGATNPLNAKARPVNDGKSNCPWCHAPRCSGWMRDCRVTGPATTGGTRTDP